MKFVFTDEQEEYRANVRSFLERKAPEAEVRSLMATESGYDPAVWRQMAEQLGLQGIMVPESLGGSGASAIEFGIVLEEMGRALLCGPYFATVALAVNVLMRCDVSAQAAYLPRIVAGELLATVAYSENLVPFEADRITTRADRRGDGWSVTGTKTLVVDGCLAELLLVAAHTDSGLSLFAVDSNDPGVRPAPLDSLDLTRKIARVDFFSATAQLIAAEGRGGEILGQALSIATVGLAAESVGAAQKCLEMSVRYAKERVQFGRLIGSFQSVRHRCANMLVAVESARSAAYSAMWTAVEDVDDLRAVGSLAKACCSDAFSYVAAENIQVHGGMGFTWEHPAHLYYRRAKSSEVFMGGPSHHRELLLQHSGF
jgi:alkylation response protein AidB-like acyl-CoA dehydrogenase